LIRRGDGLLSGRMTSSPHHFAPPAELLLLCARARPDADVASRIRALAIQVGDWEDLVDLASRHGLLPVLYTRLRDLCPGMDKDRLTGLKSQYAANARRNALLLAELLHLLDLFQAKGIVALPFKGPVLAVQAYGDYAARWSVDLDFLLRPGDMLRARDALEEDGYKLQMDLTDAQTKAYLRSCQDWAFVHPQRRVFADLNTVIASHTVSRAADVERMMNRAKSLTLDGRSVPVATPEDTLMALCIHGARHGWDRISQLADLAALIDACPAVDWERVASESRERRIRRMVLVGLSLAGTLLGAELPALMQRLAEADPAVGVLAGDVAGRMSGGLRGQRSQMATWLYCVRSREALRDKLRFLRRELLVPSTLEWQFARLPGWLYPLYYALRPLRLLVEVLRNPRKGAD
jgi:hypothetical protein